MQHPLFSHHDHHLTFKDVEEYGPTYDASSLLSYADSDLHAAAGTEGLGEISGKERVEKWWPAISTTGYGQAVTLGCKAQFDLDFCAENYDAITDRLQSELKARSAPEVFDYFVKDQSNVKWVLEDPCFAPSNAEFLNGKMYPDYYRFTWRMDDLFSLGDDGPIASLEKSTGMSIASLEDLVKAMNANIDSLKDTGRLAALKLGIAYMRDLVVAEPDETAAAGAFERVRAGKSDQADARPLADYLLHQLFQRASDEDMPVQVHTGYLAGHWGALDGTKAMHLLPVFRKYQKLRFDVFHCSWPWSAELGTIAKNYPNVYPDMCWAWTMSPSGSERTLTEWLDAVPYNKIFAYGGDTFPPWTEAGYAIQARRGIARVLERKVKKGYFSEATARDVATAIMLTNGEAFHKVG